MGLDTSWTDAHPLPGMSQKQTRTQTTQAQIRTQKRDWSEWDQFEKELNSLNEKVKTLRARWLNNELNESQYQELRRLEAALFEKTMQISQFS